MGKPPSTKVMEIFTEAATTDPAQRRTYLDHACEGDSELRAEVESLLSTQGRLSGFLGSPTVEGARGIDSDDLAPCDADSIDGDRIAVGRYSIVERIGEGGFGVVYHARQSHPLCREVAVKIVKLGMDTRQIIARFEAERQTLALMDHPNIAKVLDAGTTSPPYEGSAVRVFEGVESNCSVHVFAC